MSPLLYLLVSHVENVYFNQAAPAKKDQSRINVYPALCRKKELLTHRRFSIFASGIYILSTLILFQVFCIHIARGFYTPQNAVQAKIAPSQRIPALAAVTPNGSPRRLKIPRLRVNALVQAVGLTKEGAMEVPKRPSEAAWYKFGPEPGNTGSAVIAGHVNWLYGATGVFAKLKLLKPGDTLTIQDDHGKNITFIVRKLQEYTLAENTDAVFRSYDGKAHLNLVTCSGVWNAKTKMYTKRLVVFAEAL